MQTHYSYDPLTFRLTRLHTRRGNNNLQDLNYSYDPTGSAAQVLLKHIQARPPEPRALNPEISPALNELILHLLQKDPEQRPADAAEVGRLLALLRDLHRMAAVT